MFTESHIRRITGSQSINAQEGCESTEYISNRRKKQNKIINNKNQRSNQVKLTLEIKCVTRIQEQIDLCYFITNNLDNRQDCIICRECQSIYKAKVEGK